MEVPFLLTLLCLTIYILYTYSQGHYILCIHAIFTLSQIVTNSRTKQTDQTYKAYLPPPIPSTSTSTSTTQAQHSPTNTQQANTNTITQNTHKPHKQYKHCLICQRTKPPRYYHCRKCNICIYQMDHHCEWIGSCVGQFNFKVFLHILVNFVIVGIACLVETVGYGIQQGWLHASIVLRVVFSGFMLYQSVRMIRNFIEMVQNNQTLIETYKKVRGRRMSPMQKLTQIFGQEFSYNWFMPTYASASKCNILESAYPISIKEKDNIQEYQYADEYIYGPDYLDERPYQQKQTPHQKDKQAKENIQPTEKNKSQ